MKIIGEIFFYTSLILDPTCKTLFMVCVCARAHEMWCIWICETRMRDMHVTTPKSLCLRHV